MPSILIQASAPFTVTKTESLQSRRAARRPHLVVEGGSENPQ